MIQWSRNLYVGASCDGHEEEILHTLEKGENIGGIYLLTLSDNHCDSLEILESRFLRQDWVRRLLPEIIGLAGSKAEALAMVEAITQECLEKTGDADLRAYLRATD